MQCKRSFSPKDFNVETNMEHNSLRFFDLFLIDLITTSYTTFINLTFDLVSLKMTPAKYCALSCFPKATVTYSTKNPGTTKKNPWLAYLSSLSTCDAAGVEVAGVPGAEEPSEVRRFLRLSSRGSGSGDKMNFLCVHIYNFTAKHQYRQARSKFQCVFWNTEKQHGGPHAGEHQADLETNHVHIYNFIARRQS